MSQPSPRGNFIQTLLIVTVIFLGFQMFFGQRQVPQDPRSPEDIMRAMEIQVNEIKERTRAGFSVVQVLREMEAAGRQIEVRRQFGNLNAAQLMQQMRWQNELILDRSISVTVDRYHQVIDTLANLDAADPQRLTPTEAAERKMQATVLHIDTQYKSGVQREDFLRIVAAHDAVSALARRHSAEPVWSQSFSVAYHPDFPREQVTPASLKQEVQFRSNELGRTTPVWGFFPGYQFIDFLVRMTGSISQFSYAFAALILAILVRAIVWPLAQRQFMWGRQMAQLAPLIAEIKEEFKPKKPDQRPDPAQQAEMNQRIMGLYREYGINPAAGCAPMLLQMPLFFLVYQTMLHYRFEFQNGTFLWINPVASEMTGGWLAANLGQKDYILIVVYAISMIVTTFLMPVSDPSNIRQQRTLGVSMAAIFGVLMFFWPVPSAFVLYWVFLNILTTLQSLRAYSLPLPPLQKVGTSAGGAIPVPGKTIARDAPSNGQIASRTSTGVPKKHKPKKKK
jgi:YidC/Oxa1 family membrane protein insertase